jgi:DNA mismatch endonuclease (patch repair protein)
MAEANRSFWQEKIQANRRRDRDTDHRLEESGWRVLRVWEHEAADDAARRVRLALYSPGESPRNKARRGRAHR